MRHRFRTAIAGALLLAASAVPAASQAAGQGAVFEQGARPLQFHGDQSFNTSTLIYTVPANRVFHVTDLIVSDWGTDTCAVYLSGKTGEMLVQAHTTAQFRFLSGPYYKAGSQVYLGNNARIPGPDPGCMLTYTVMGYVRVRR